MSSLVHSPVYFNRLALSFCLIILCLILLQVTSDISEFWEPVSDLGGQDSSLQNSRYLNDFEELQSLGKKSF